MDTSLGKYANSPKRLIGFLVLTALTFIVALAVNDAVQRVLNYYFPRDESIWGYIIYAVIIVVAAFLIVWLGYKYLPQFFPKMENL